MKKKFYYLAGVDIKDEQLGSAMVDNFINDLKKQFYQLRLVRFLPYWPLFKSYRIPEMDILEKKSYVIEISAHEIIEKKIKALLKMKPLWADNLLFPYLKFEKNENEIIPIEWLDDNAKDFFE